MKKRFWSLLLIAAMLASMIVMPVYAQQESTKNPTGYCEYCKEVIPQEQWLPWDVTNVGPRTGHYYLAADTTAQDEQITINLDDDLYRNKICLDLRGCSYGVDGFRPFLVYGVFSIMDSVGGGEFSFTGSSAAHGGFCQITKKSGCMDGSGEVNIYGGTFRKVNTSDSKEVTAYGGVAYLSSAATLNIYDGTLVGGEVKPRLNTSGTALTARGGTIYATAANVNIYGGTITGGVACDGTIADASDPTKNYDATGGNLYAEKSSVVTIYNGTIENGYSDSHGGNMVISDSTLDIQGGLIRNGYSNSYGGNICLSGDSKFTVSGGKIIDGVAGSMGGNLYVHNKNAELTISGGEIYGDLRVGIFKSFTLSGSPKIYLGKSNGLRLHETNSTKVDISGLTEGALIYLDGKDQVFTEVLENPETYLGYFRDAIRADISVDETGALKVIQGTTGFCPHCIETGEQATWTEWTNPENSTDKAKLVSIKSDAHYYLTRSFERTGIISIGTEDVTTNDVVFDLNGKTWKTDDKKVFNLYSKLSLVDSIGGGEATGTGYAGVNGGVIMGSGACEFNLYSGTISRTVDTDELLRNVQQGGVLYCSGTGSKINIYGGTIADGVSASYKDSACSGGNIYSGGYFTMTAGAIRGGKALSTGYVKNDVNTHITSSDKPVNSAGKGGNVYVYGYAYFQGGHVVGGNASMGGNIYMSSSIKEISFSNCVIRGGICNETEGLTDSSLDLTISGGNIYVTGKSSKRVDLQIENVLIRDGVTEGAAQSKDTRYGGNLYLTYTDLTLKNSFICDGTAGDSNGGRGGNLYFTGSVAADFYDSTIGNGYARSHGGNLYAPGGVNVRMHSGLVVGGKTATYGGNLYCNGLNIYGGVITGGIVTGSSGSGANIFVYEGSGNYMNIEADRDDATPAPRVSNGRSAKLGGNIYLDSNTTGTITGAIILDGVGDTGNKVSGVNGDNVYAEDGTTLTITDTQILNIDADANHGNGVFTEGSLTLKGATSIINEAKDSCVCIDATGSLTVDAGFTGIASVAFADAHLADPQEPQVGHIAEQNTTTGVYSGQLFLEGYGAYDYGTPAIFAESGDTKLYVASTALEQDGQLLWFKDAQAAAQAAGDGDILTLYATNNTFCVSGDLIMDMNGKNATVSGSGTVYGFDSQNDDYEGYGLLQLSGVNAAPAFLAPNGKQYVTVAGEEGTSFHRMGIETTNVSVRPSIAGIYFNARWSCDTVLQGKLKTYGVAVSTANMPDATFATDGDTDFTAYTPDTFQNGVSQTSVMIANIIKPGEDNAARGAMVIYCAPYVVIDDGSETGLAIVSDDKQPDHKGVAYSLKRVMELVDLRWPQLTETQQAALKSVYELDPSAMDQWKVYNLRAAVNGTASVRPLKILTLGHSLAVDSGHMLNLIAATEGYDQELIVGTLYYSGCKLYEHARFLKEDAAVYKLYLSSTLTPEKPPVSINAVTMGFAIEYDDWDIIVLQGGTIEITKEECWTDGRVQTIIDYVNEHKTNPNAVFAWHMPWATPTDNDLRDMYPYSPNSYYSIYEPFNHDRVAVFDAFTASCEAHVLTDSTYVYFIPTGTSIENAVSSYLTEKDLFRDYAHVSDLGRVIAAYTWYCTLAGVDHLDEIKLDAIPKAFLKSTKDKTQDRVLSEAEKAIILEAVNNALADPTHLTESQYKVAP